MKFWLTLSNYLFGIIGALASIISLAIAYSKNEKDAIIAFHILLGLIFLTYLTFMLVKYKALAKHPYSVLYGQAKWTWINNTHSVYENIFVLKSHKFYIQKFDIKGFWTGRGTYEVKSLFGNNLVHRGETSNLAIEYPVNASLGETKAVGYSIETEDRSTDQKPFLAHHIARPSAGMIMEVVLKHKEHNPPAKLCCLNCPSDCIESATNFGEIPFDAITKSYRWVIPDPLVGKTYRMDWEK